MEGNPHRSHASTEIYAQHLPYHRRPSPLTYAAPSPAPSTLPMSITNTVRESPPPPPLPPPRHIEEVSEGQDPGWQFANRHHNDREEQIDAPSSVVKPGSSLLGGNQMKQGKPYNGPERRVDFDRPGQMEGSPASNPESKNDGSEQSQERIPDLQALLEYKYASGICT